MQYLMAPLEEHYDDGFGAIGEAFNAAAAALAKANGADRMFWSDLPVIFLLRHAIELFLKSGIIIVHRKLKLPYGSEPYSSAKPMLITPDGSWKPLFKTHDLPELYSYWKQIITEHKERLTMLSRRKPDMSVPEELDGWVKALGATDPSSDYFRYPVSKNRSADKEKSTHKEVAMESLFPSEPSDEKVHALVLKDADGNWVRAFKHDASTNKAVEEAAWKAADMLFNFHVMMRMELTEGW
jgi:hypothetical protein